MTPDPYYNPDCALYLALDFGWRNPTVNLWIQPDRKWERVIVLFAHYQTLGTNEENAKLALKIHQERGYGLLAQPIGGWGDPSKPEALVTYSQVFGSEIKGPRQSVQWGHELVKQWLKTSKQSRGEMGLVFSRYCPQRLFVEMREYEKHEPGKGAHHAPDALRYFFAGWVGA